MQVVIGAGAKVQPYSIVTPGLELAAGDTLASATCAPLAAPRRGRAKVKSVELCRGLCNPVDSQELDAWTCAVFQVRGSLVLVKAAVVDASPRFNDE